MELRLVRRSDGLLEAWDDETLEVIKRTPIGHYMPGDFKEHRGLVNHRRWFAFRNHTFDMQDMYDDKEVWRGVLQIYGGRCKTVVDSKGNSHIWPESISWKVFDDEHEFKKMFHRAVQAFLAHHGKGMTEQELLRIIDFQPFR